MEDEKGELVVASTFMAIKTAEILQLLKKAEKEHGHTDNSASEKDGAGATHERENEINEINVFWNKIAMKYSHGPCIMCPATDGDDCGFWEGTCAASLRKKYESIAGIPPKNAKKMVLPVPVKQVDGVDVKTWAVKQWFSKINEELDELKNAILSLGVDLDCTAAGVCDYRYNGSIAYEVADIADEACDTITAITSMLEAMGIDEQQRQEAQGHINERNKERDRL